jgi:hypothetical protein
MSVKIGCALQEVIKIRTGMASRIILRLSQILRSSIIVTPVVIPVFDPSGTNIAHALKQFSAEFCRVLDHGHHACAERALRLFNPGQSRTLSRDHILNRNLHAMCLEILMAVRIVTGRV